MDDWNFGASRQRLGEVPMGPDDGNELGRSTAIGRSPPFDRFRGVFGGFWAFDWGQEIASGRLQMPPTVGESAFINGRPNGAAGARQTGSVGTSP